MAPFPVSDQPPVAPWAAQAVEGGRGSKLIPGPIGAAGSPSGLPTAEPRGTAAAACAEGKKAAPGAADPEAAAFVGRSCVHGAGRGGGGGKTPRDPGRENGVRRDPVADPGVAGRRGCGRHGIHRPPPLPATAIRKRRGHSHGCAGLQGPRAVGALGVAWPARAAAAAVAAAGACPSLRPAAPPRRAPPPAFPQAPAPLRGAHSSLHLRG